MSYIFIFQRYWHHKIMLSDLSNVWKDEEFLTSTISAKWQYNLIFSKVKMKLPIPFLGNLRNNWFYGKFRNSLETLKQCFSTEVLRHTSVPWIFLGVPPSLKNMLKQYFFQYFGLFLDFLCAAKLFIPNNLEQLWKPLGMLSWGPFDHCTFSELKIWVFPK